VQNRVRLGASDPIAVSIEPRWIYPLFGRVKKILVSSTPLVGNRFRSGSLMSVHGTSRHFDAMRDLVAIGV
jgi:hypothetical protein